MAAEFARKRVGDICFLANIAPHFSRNRVADQWLASCSGRTLHALTPWSTSAALPTTRQNKMRKPQKAWKSQRNMLHQAMTNDSSTTAGIRLFISLKPNQTA